MFGIPSLLKLAVLGVLLFVGWNMFKWLKSASSGDKKSGKETLDAEVCAKCGIYIAACDESPNCNDAACPYN